MSYNGRRINRQQRTLTWSSRGHFQGCTVWLTGLSGSGKSTIAFALEKYIVNKELSAYCLDADVIRQGLNSNLQYSLTSCMENVRRVAEVSKLFSDAGTISLVSFISPYRESREHARKIHEDCQLPFIEVYVSTSLSVCESRDIKGLYRKARTGEITNLVGIQVPYEAPTNPDVIIDTNTLAIDQAVQIILNKLVQKRVISPTLGFLVRELFILNSTTQDVISDASKFGKLEITEHQIELVHILSEGWATPLNGFMRENEYFECVHLSSTIGSTENQYVPIVLSCSNEDKIRNQSYQTIALSYKNKLIALLKNYEFFKSCKQQMCVHTYKLFNIGNPYWTEILENREWFIGGDLEVIERIRFDDCLNAFRFTPNEIRKHFYDMQADAVFAMEFEGPMHNGHLFQIEIARKWLWEHGYKKPVLLIHPSVCQKTGDDFPLNVLISQYQACLSDSTDYIITLFPSPIMYLSPDVSRWYFRAHIVAGVHFYAISSERLDLLKTLTMQPDLRQLEIIPLETVAYHRSTQQMTFYNSHKHDEFDFVPRMHVKDIIQTDQKPPNGYMSEEGWNILITYCKTLNDTIERNSNNFI